MRARRSLEGLDYKGFDDKLSDDSGDFESFPERANDDLDDDDTDSMDIKPKATKARKNKESEDL